MSDFISREDALEVAKAHWYKPDIVGALEQLPSADVRENVRANDIGDERIFHCSNCGYGIADIFEHSESETYLIEHGKELNFCPNCGADMRGKA